MPKNAAKKPEAKAPKRVRAPKAAKSAKSPAGSKVAKKGHNIFEDEEPRETSTEEELPKDEVGRRKIKRQYEDLLGIRIQKLRGRILNRERINKTIEGIYFICAQCAKVCHNVDDGLTEDPDNVRNLCGACSPKPRDTKGKGRQAAA